jgi:DedD protein
LNDILKQRLVGALVIIALAVVLWPLIFVEPTGEPLDRTSQVPRMPQVETVRVAQPEPIEGLPPAVTNEREVLHEAPPQALDDFEPPEDAVVTGAEADESGAEADTGSPVDDQELSPEEIPAAPTLDEEGIPIAWTLQVISVSNQERAENLAQELVAMGHKAYVKPLSRGSGRLYKVYIGPVFDRQKLSDLKPVIDEKFKVQSIVSRYVP